MDLLHRAGKQLIAGVLTEVLFQWKADLGIELINSRKSKYEQASDLERKGIDALIEGDFKLALDSYESAEKVYPTFHWAYEISRLLKKNEKDFDNEDIKKSIRKKIVSDYSRWIPEDKLKKLADLSK